MGRLRAGLFRNHIALAEVVPVFIDFWTLETPVTAEPTTPQKIHSPSVASHSITGERSSK